MPTIQFHEAQKLIASDTHRFRVACCGRRFGKSVLATYEMIGKAVGKSGRNIVYISTTYQQSRDIIWNILKNIVNPIVLDTNESRLEVVVATKDGGKSTIRLRGWESLETLRGQTFDFMVLDEVASYRGFLAGWQEILRPTLTDTRGECLFISTPKGFNHFYDLFNLENSDSDYKSFHYSSYDNPFLPVDELDKAKTEIPEDRFAQEYLADFRKTFGLVYKEFNREKHLFDDESIQTVKFNETIAGVDFGFKNPCAVISLRRDSDDNFWVTNEFYQTGKTDAEVAEYVSGQKFNKVYPDPESPSGIKELKDHGVNVRTVIKGKDSVKNGIDAVRELFKAGRLKIHKKCSNLIWELETYSYPDKKDQHNEQENPIKENDHACDALRYPLMMLGSSNDRVAHTYYPGQVSRNPYQPVTPNGNTNGQTTYPSFIRQ